MEKTKVLFKHNGVNCISLWRSEIFSTEYSFNVNGTIYHLPDNCKHTNYTSDRPDKFIIPISLFLIKELDLTSSVKNLIESFGYALVLEEVIKNNLSNV